MALPASGAAGGGRGERASRRPGPGQPPGGSPPGAGGPAPGGGRDTAGACRPAHRGARHPDAQPPHGSGDRTGRKKDRRPGGGEHPRRGAAGLLPEPHPTHLHHPHPSSPGLPVPGRVCPGFGGAALEKSAPVAADRGEGGADRPPGPGSAPGAGGSSTCPECGGPPVRSRPFPGRRGIRAPAGGAGAPGDPWGSGSGEPDGAAVDTDRTGAAGGEGAEQPLSGPAPCPPPFRGARPAGLPFGGPGSGPSLRL